ncbi:MAG: hypothetical protein KKD05_05380 [Candidatus Omnitrophica bacterium]|nr:hypothetical protein [Candidatus Omnitrophota bacterium]
MKKIIIGLICLGFILGIADISFAESWNARKNKVKQLLKKNNLVSSDRFELVYAQKITDRMSNHFVYILQDSQTGMEYLIYTVGDGNSTIINNLAISPLLLPQPGQTPTINKIITQTSMDDDADSDEDEDTMDEPKDSEENDDQDKTEKKI